MEEENGERPRSLWGGSTPSEQQLQRIVEHSAPVILQIDSGAIIRFAAGYHLDSLGLSAESLLGTSFSEFISTHEPTLLVLQQALGGEFGTSEVPLSGCQFEIRLTPMVDQVGAIAGITAVFVDITERSIAAEELGRSEASFRVLTESSPDAIIVHRFGRIVYANNAAGALLQHGSVSELMGRPVLEFFSKDDRPQAMQRIRDSTGSSEQYRDRFRLVRRSGEEGSFEVTTMAAQYDGGTATVHVARDITQALRMQTKLAQTERLASLGTLASGVGHEINNPLAYMTANLSFLIEELTRLLPPDLNEDNAELHHALRDVQDGTGRVKDIIRQLNEFTRVDSDVEELIDPRSAIEAAVRMSWNHVRRSARLETHLLPIDSVRGSTSRLGQVFLALLLNASAALAEQHISESEICISSHQEGENVVIRVSDNGPGIPEEILTNIFDPFFSATPGAQGTGLGLSVAHSIVVGMGGSIDVTTKPNEGTCVEINLPRAQERRGEVAGDRRILVVTGDVRFLEAAQIALRGNRIRIAGRMSIASPELDGESLDAILCDISSADVDLPTFGNRANRHGGVLLWLSQQLDQVPQEHRDIASLCLQKPIGADRISMQLSKLWPTNSS
ncbi:MAG: PAS domain S-box protein [Myxococcales bacterium]|nr:PAS domain S-box protein [Myxococcales bacterium]